MQSEYINLTWPNGLDGDTESIGPYPAARRVSLCSLILRVINSELTVLSAWLTPPPPINN